MGSVERRRRELAREPPLELADTDVIPLHRCRPLVAGDRLEPYVLVEKLGLGGMGEVFLAEHEDLGRRVAIKVLHPDHVRNPRMHERFTREARLCNRVRHENVVAVTDQGRLPDGRPWLAMELCDGVDVATHARAGLSLPRFIAIARAMVDALDAAHTAGVVHRDLKPSNVLVGAGDRVKLLDFGAARSPDDIDDRLTQPGQILVTPSYMSPEQSTGEPVDARSDLYSLGIILWELCVGERPFAGRSFGELVLLHATQAPLPPSRAPSRQLTDAIPPALDAIILKLLAKRPEQRFATAAEVRDALDALQPVRPRRWILAAPLSLAFVAAFAAGVTLLPGRAPAPVADPAARPIPSVAAHETPARAEQPQPVEAAPAPPAIAVPPLYISLTPTFAPTIVTARPAHKKPRPRSEGPVSSDELKDPYGAAP